MWKRRKYEAFQYWVQTNTEKGVTTIPDTLCLFVVNLIKSLQKENEKLKNKLLDTLEGKKVIEEETPQYIKENYIPKSKLKDKIEELNKQLEEDLQDGIKVNSNRFIIICQCKSCLQELLESEE